MITVAGEILIDVVVGRSGSLSAHPGGAPFNVARTIARLGADCQFLGRLSDDAFGRRLRDALAEAGVQLPVSAASGAPSTLAIAQLDDSGSAEYRFYLEGTAAGQLAPADLPADVLAGCSAFVFGGLGLLIEPLASTLAGLLADKPAGITTVLDPNCRPDAIADLDAYRASVERILGDVDVVKVSVDDLRLLRPGTDAGAAARNLLESGPRTVLVTDGPAPVAIHTADAERSVPVPVVEIADTIGAGDAFVAGFTTWWTDHGLGREDVGEIELLTRATAAAIRVSAADCTMAGAALPADFTWPVEESQPHAGLTRG